MIHENPYKLSSEDLERVKTELLEIVEDPGAEAKDRIAAAKQLSFIYDQVMKYAPTQEEQEAVKDGIEYLKGLTLVG